MSPGPRDLVIRGRTARFCGTTFPCQIGRNGITGDKREGDGATPAGWYRAERVLYRPDRTPPPATCLPRHPIRRDWGWSDDPDDPEYNRAVRRPHGFSAESLWLPTCLYDLLVVLDWNRDPVVAGRGSAIFLHVLDPLARPTAGCVSLEAGWLCRVLAGWQPASRLLVEDPAGTPAPDGSHVCVPARGVARPAPSPGGTHPMG